jgi:hypothetical protein
MTRTFETLAAQGDIALRRIAALPEGLHPVPAENGKHILAHSETGHHHTVLERPDVQHFSAMDEFRSYLVVEGEPVDLVHERAFDTHETLRIKPGIYEVRRQREYTPEGLRRAAD